MCANACIRPKSITKRMKNDSNDLTSKKKIKAGKAFCPSLAPFQRDPCFLFCIMKDEC